MILSFIVTAVLAYLIGSIPTGYIIVKLLKNEDIRDIGSGSTGATNVKRALGKKWFITVMVLDAIKGFLPVFISQNMSRGGEDIHFIAPVIAGFMVLLGHAKPIFLNFKGGKSVASGVGTIIALNPTVGISIAAIWAIVTFVTRYVSVGSITAVLLSPVLMLTNSEPMSYVVYCTIMGLAIIYLHKDNLERLKKGEENKIR